MKVIKEVIAKAWFASPRELRTFGLIFAAFVVGLFFLLIPWLAKGTLGPLPVLWTGGVVALLALVLPLLLRPLFVAASVVGFVLGAVNNRILLCLAFFLILWPIATIMRLFSGADLMRRRLDTGADTYRVSSTGRDLLRNKEKTF